MRSWPLVLAAPAAAEVWSGWGGIAQKTGFGLVSLLPGVLPSLHLDTLGALPGRLRYLPGLCSSGVSFGDSRHLGFELAGVPGQQAHGDGPKRAFGITRLINAASAGSRRTLSWTEARRFFFSAMASLRGAIHRWQESCRIRAQAAGNWAIAGVSAAPR